MKVAVFPSIALVLSAACAAGAVDPGHGLAGEGGSATGGSGAGGGAGGGAGIGSGDAGGSPSIEDAGGSPGVPDAGGSGGGLPDAGGPRDTGPPPPDLIVAPDLGPPGQTTTINLQVASGLNDANQDGATLEMSSNPMWIGTGGSQNSFTGVRFSGVAIPRNARIVSATLSFYVQTASWHILDMNIAAEDVDDSVAFGPGNPLATRTLTTMRVPHMSDVNWPPGWNTLGNGDSATNMAAVIQEVVNRPGWNPGNSLSIIVTSRITYWRKFMASADANPAYGARLVVGFVP